MTSIRLLLLATLLIAAVPAAHVRAQEATREDEPEALKLENIELRAPCVTLSEDGTYYLTGTTNINTLDPRYADFQNNDGIRLWKSQDLKTWESVGLVWDLSKTGGRDASKSGWQAHLRSVPDDPDRPWSRGVTAPELHRVKDAWYMIFALNDQDIGLLKSKTGKPEGPYEEIGRMSNRFLGGDGSLFEDTDGTVYMVWGAGYIAPMKGDMSDIAEEPRALQMTIRGYPEEMPLANQRGERGAFIFHDGGKYHFVYSAWNLRDGQGHFDAVVCEAPVLHGPYSRPRLLATDVQRQAMLLRSANGAVMTMFSRGDKPVIMPFARR